MLAGFLAAGVAATWPLATYITGRLPATRDAGIYVWDLWWVAHQIIHLHNPWSTTYMAAPVGLQLAYHTLVPLLGVVMMPVTLAFGPSAAYNLLLIVLPGLSGYAMYRVARLWLPTRTGAIAAGAFFGLSGMLTYQDWYHINIAYGTAFLPVTLEAAVRLRRRPAIGQGVILGVVLAGCLLVNQESAVMALILAALACFPGWPARAPGGGPDPAQGPGGRRGGLRRGRQPPAGRDDPADPRGRDHLDADVAGLHDVGGQREGPVRAVAPAGQ